MAYSIFIKEFFYYYYLFLFWIEVEIFAIFDILDAKYTQIVEINCFILNNFFLGLDSWLL